MMPTLSLLSLLACTDPPKPPPPPAWTGGSVQAVALPDGGTAVLDVAWRTDAPLLSPDRVPATATVSLRRLDPEGAVTWEEVLVAGDRAAAHALVALPDGDLVALVTAPGTPATTGLLRIGPAGPVGRLQPIGDAILVRGRAMAVDHRGRLHVGGSTTAPLRGHLQASDPTEPDGAAGFVARMDHDLAIASVHLWDEAGDQVVSALVRADEGIAFLGSTRPRGRHADPPRLGRLNASAPIPVAGIDHATDLVWTADGPILAGWSKLGEDRSGLPGSMPLALRVLALDAAGGPRWSTAGCCATWAHPVDLQLDGDALLVGGRADASTLELGGRSTPGGAGVQAFVARIEPGSGAVQALSGLGQVGETPLNLPVSVLAGRADRTCLVAAAGTPPQCAP